MITIVFSIMMLVVFGRLLGVAIRASWGILKFLLGLVFLPAIIIGAFALGLIYVAFPILIIAGFVSFLLPGKAM